MDLTVAPDGLDASDCLDTNDRPLLVVAGQHHIPGKRSLGLASVGPQRPSKTVVILRVEVSE